MNHNTKEEEIKDDIHEVCVITAGSVDAGKSTFIGTCISGKRDDGNGSLRVLVAKHQHEKDRGKTSDISVRILKIAENKDLALVDLCGHEKYLKTTTFGMTGYFPDYAIVVIAGNKGTMEVMTKEHIKLLINMKIPFAVFITREDIAPHNIFKSTLKSIKRLKKAGKQVIIINKDRNSELLKRIDLIKEKLSSQLIDKHILEVSEILEDYFKTGTNYDSTMKRLLSIKDIPDNINIIIQDIFENIIENLQENVTDEINNYSVQLKDNINLVPVITLSNKTGYFLKTAQKFLFNLTARKSSWDENKSTIFYVDDRYTKKGYPLILSGIVKGQPLCKNDVVYIGPFVKQFIELKIKTIHNNRREFVDKLTNTHRGCIAVNVIDKKFKEFSKENVRKGMIVVRDKKILEKICYQFDADVEILEHPTSIRNGFCTTIHSNTIRQTARIILGKDVVLNMGKRGKATFRFIQRPEYLEEGNLFVSREGKTKIRGTITKIYPAKDDTKGPDIIRRKKNNTSIRKLKTSNKKGNTNTV